MRHYKIPLLNESDHTILTDESTTPILFAVSFGNSRRARTMLCNLISRVSGRPTDDQPSDGECAHPRKTLWSSETHPPVVIGCVDHAPTRKLLREQVHTLHDGIIYHQSIGHQPCKRRLGTCDQWRTIWRGHMATYGENSKGRFHNAVEYSMQVIS
ncbi:hypothetical protein MM817_02875 [Acidibacillus sp. S0AB]|uniref:Uncharacterized protein n=1 Tax=Sulfoacidibacillus ferrooxidans TaxID=2005001 RepID=A0A9X1VAU4_9BACL|nr:hypothetical protein [Sulfoacidibacillus ferrooxidans]